MGSADFSQFVVTTANETACETSTLKVHALFPHLPATFTGTSSNFWTSSCFADLSVFPSLICGSCSSGQGFAYSFLQIPPRGGHPCCSAMYFVVAYAHSGLSPVRARPWRANKSCRTKMICAAAVFYNSGLFKQHFYVKGRLVELFLITKLLKTAPFDHLETFFFKK